MKKKLLLILIAAVSFCACNPANTTRIKSSDGTNTLNIKYTGRIVFDTLNTAIASMEPGAYLEYEHNGEELKAEADDKGRISYEFDGAKTISPDENQKTKLRQAIREILKQRHSR